MTHPSLNELSLRLARGETTSRALVEESFARIADPHGEGARAFLTLYAERARAEADAVDAARTKGDALPRFAGIPLSIKDLFDVEGEPTRAGSRALADAPAARADADTVALARRAGFVIVGKTNMTEFAYSGLGVNPHYGTPLSPWDRARGHIPGGSTSGGAVSVADGMTPATVGTDTGGSCRIPAAFCGIVGFKPTQARVSLKGGFPLSPSLDSIGPLATSVSCCAALDSVLSGGPGEVEPPAPLGGLAIGVIEGYVDERLDPRVAAAFAGALARLAKAGAELKPIRLPELAELPHLYRNGSLVDFEAFDGHRVRIETMGAKYDPWVLGRLEASKGKSAADYAGILAERARIRASVDARTRDFDVLALPTVAIAPPAIVDLADLTASRAINALTVRNAAIANFLDRPAISIPCHAPGDAPVGFMFIGQTGHDRRLLAAALGAEDVVRGG
jgi:aspartyl-tRNA(Asn)/glutamyl-tRNA(Gln) amidotransferase subunit A